MQAQLSSLLKTCTFSQDPDGIYSSHTDAMRQGSGFHLRAGWGPSLGRRSFRDILFGEIRPASQGVAQRWRYADCHMILSGAATDFATRPVGATDRRVRCS